SMAARGLTSSTAMLRPRSPLAAAARTSGVARGSRYTVTRTSPPRLPTSLSSSCAAERASPSVNSAMARVMVEMVWTTGWCRRPSAPGRHNVGPCGTAPPGPPAQPPPPDRRRSAAVGDDPALLQPHDPLLEALDHRQIVGCHHHRRATHVGVREQAHDLLGQ